jgi:decaprenylphospho-beta-D-erythro-pentofuranosid-2-ulose 2-reductase
MTVTGNPRARVLVIGATSAIATAVMREFAKRGARICLVGRREEALNASAADLGVRGASATEVIVLDANDIARHRHAMDAAWSAWSGIDVALIAHGVLPDQLQAQASVEDTLACLDTNARSVIALLTDLTHRFESQRSGVIGVISSPAGDRGRASNYVYGAAKAAVTNFASGLRHRLFAAGVRVVTILPGFVDTPMTKGFRKGPLWTSPERVAVDIVRGLDRRNGTLYTPWFWRWIMLAVVHLPQRLFLRTRL